MALSSCPRLSGASRTGNRLQSSVVPRAQRNGRVNPNQGQPSNPNDAAFNQQQQLQQQGGYQTGYYAQQQGGGSYAQQGGYQQRNNNQGGYQQQGGYQSGAYPNQQGGNWGDQGGYVQDGGFSTDFSTGNSDINLDFGSGYSQQGGGYKGGNQGGYGGGYTQQKGGYRDLYDWNDPYTNKAPPRQQRGQPAYDQYSYDDDQLDDEDYYYGGNQDAYEDDWPDKSTPQQRIVNGKQLLINMEIKADRVRVLAGVGGADMLGVIPIREALNRAREQRTDLILLNPDTDPPLCRLIKWSKYKYEVERDQKSKAAKAANVETKEVRLRPGTDTNDLNVKLKNAQKFLEKGNKVKLVMKFEGRQLQFKEQGKTSMLKFVEDLADVGKLDGPVNFKTGTYTAMLSPTGKKVGGSGGKDGEDERPAQSPAPTSSGASLPLPPSLPPAPAAGPAQAAAPSLPPPPPPPAAAAPPPPPKPATTLPPRVAGAPAPTTLPPRAPPGAPGARPPPPPPPAAGGRPGMPPPPPPPPMKAPLSAGAKGQPR